MTVFTVGVPCLPTCSMSYCCIWNRVSKHSPPLSFIEQLYPPFWAIHQPDITCTQADRVHRCGQQCTLWLINNIQHPRHITKVQCNMHVQYTVYDYKLLHNYIKYNEMIELKITSDCYTVTWQHHPMYIMCIYSSHICSLTKWRLNTLATSGREGILECVYIMW